MYNRQYAVYLALKTNVYRKERGISQHDLGKLIHVPQATICCVEQMKNISNKAQKKLEKLLGITKDLYESESKIIFKDSKPQDKYTLNGFIDLSNINFETLEHKLKEYKESVEKMGNTNKGITNEEKMQKAIVNKATEDNNQADKPSYMKYLISLLKHKKTKDGLSYKALSNEVGIPASTLYDIIARNQSSMRHDAVVATEKYFNVSYDPDKFTDGRNLRPAASYIKPVKNSNDDFIDFLIEKLVKYKSLKGYSYSFIAKLLNANITGGQLNKFVLGITNLPLEAFLALKKLLLISYDKDKFSLNNKRQIMINIHDKYMDYLRMCINNYIVSNNESAATISSAAGLSYNIINVIKTNKNKAISSSSILKIADYIGCLNFIEFYENIAKSEQEINMKNEEPENIPENEAAVEKEITENKEQNNEYAKFKTPERLTTEERYVPIHIGNPDSVNQFVNQISNKESDKAEFTVSLVSKDEISRLVFNVVSYSEAAEKINKSLSIVDFGSLIIQCDDFAMNINSNNIEEAIYKMKMLFTFL